MTFTLACSDFPLGKRVFDGINNLYEWEELGKVTRVHKVRRTNHTSSRQNTPKHGADLGVQFHRVRERNHNHQLVITLPTRQKNPKSLHLELSQRRTLNGQFLLVGYAMFATVVGASVAVDETNTAATVDTIFEVDKSARKSTVWNNTPLTVHAHHSPYGGHVH